MNSKKIIITTSIILLCIAILFILYLIFIKPIITGTYTPTKKDCLNSYNCVCLNENCNCTYKKLFKESILVCPKKDLKDKQIKH